MEAIKASIDVFLLFIVYSIGVKTQTDKSSAHAQIIVCTYNGCLIAK
jgi:hypothetical protein